jgi:hypothetical protein
MMNDPKASALVEAMKRLQRDTRARRGAMPASEAYDIALAAEERSERQVMDLARRVGGRSVAGS